MALGGGQPIQVEALQDPPHPRFGDGDVVVSLQIHDDLVGPEVVVLAEVDDLSHHLG